MEESVQERAREMAPETILKLPPELWHEIAQLLPKKDLMVLRHSCSSFKNIADEWLFRDIGLDLAVMASWSRVEKFLENLDDEKFKESPVFIIPRRIHLFVDYVLFDDRTKDAVKVLGMIIPYLPHLLRAFTNLREVEVVVGNEASRSDLINPFFDAVFAEEFRGRWVVDFNMSSQGLVDGFDMRQLRDLRTFNIWLCDWRSPVAHGKILADVMARSPGLKMAEIVHDDFHNDGQLRFDEILSQMQTFNVKELSVAVELPVLPENLKKLHSVERLIAPNGIAKDPGSDTHGLFWQAAKRAMLAPPHIESGKVGVSFFDYLLHRSCLPNWPQLRTLDIRLPQLDHWTEMQDPLLGTPERLQAAEYLGDQFYAKVLPGLLPNLESLILTFTEFLGKMTYTDEWHAHCFNLWEVPQLRPWMVQWGHSHQYIKELYHPLKLHSLTILAMLEQENTNLDDALDAIAILLRRCSKLHKVTLCVLHHYDIFRVGEIETFRKDVQRTQEKPLVWGDGAHDGVPDGRRFTMISRSHAVCMHNPTDELSMEMEVLTKKYISRRGRWIAF